MTLRTALVGISIFGFGMVVATPAALAGESDAKRPAQTEKSQKQHAKRTDEPATAQKSGAAFSALKGISTHGVQPMSSKEMVRTRGKGECGSTGFCGPLPVQSPGFRWYPSPYNPWYWPAP